MANHRAVVEYSVAILTTQHFIHAKNRLSIVNK